jgi:hypothetical protein
MAFQTVVPANIGYHAGNLPYRTGGKAAVQAFSIVGHVRSRAPWRSYEPLAIRICKAVHTIMGGERSQWASVAKLSQFIKVKDEEMLSSAITLAAQKGWLMVGGRPVHSVVSSEG